MSCGGKEPDSTFPISLDDGFHAAQSTKYQFPRLYFPLSIRGDYSYYANAFFGPEVSESDRLIAERIVESITPPRRTKCELLEQTA